MASPGHNSFPPSKNLYISIIPTGSYEYHGENLPYDTDSVLAEKIVSRCITSLKSMKNVNIQVYPALKYGYSIEWIKYPGTISIDPKTYLDMLESIVDFMEKNISPAGYIFVNGHGGNYSLLEVFSRKKFYELKKPFIIIDIWRIASRYGLKYCHGCLFEQQLYSYLTGQSIKENYREEQVCSGYNELLKGYIEELKIGGCGNINIEPGVFVNKICMIIGEAIKIIIDHSQN
ncbi:creatininase family protein [Staphylothermus hellenicus]|uniref:Uncharacterized protein putative amidase-like protein n=1 Tax=Staphylothermus hellenicus (strain DSM 12710 / JCM 10830 / BK20S6-10-b1 / P8) TaxID=591019 RepID=D7DAL1_STAHD|nr:creatininase family protein [Staphylothermus hellenicus]ADI31208.1 Uncharacterized protein putative amidase-like protein [Staphylothermus hellenicus DSM 12710]